MLSFMMLPRGGWTSGSAGCAALQQLAARRVSSSTASTSASENGAAQGQQSATPPSEGISPAALNELKAASKQVTQVARSASTLATLTALSGHYRDTLTSMEALYWQQVEGVPPRGSGIPAPPRPSQPRSSHHSCTLFPMLDVTTLPDNHRSLPPPGGPQLDVQYMDRLTCWKQVQPNHIETSTLLLSGISLFPPQEATYPTYVDFQSALRLLRMHKSRKRMTMMKRRRSRQDKYQLKTWDHHIGE
ncbi:hypothetical protein DUNSADRAFT_13826 [Dunaliella salina]|uniref:Mitochondrial mRNA-processing protein COX24 C-terminal domain-containing protein n=1 Tax=Dunaliella salina TaxID=3046 RepID=A0ABQ7G8N0_DUNSA|nr:hypothetical protein DUNSADRAFT_13826 [Dunaliella salina]|eukprot:KAF5830943.1 hypothetical protein DUNSADRAFT_13826 [Dunaliella salina]